MHVTYAARAAYESQSAYWAHPEGVDSDVFASGRGRHPVVHVSHDDAAAFCSWAVRKTRARSF